MEQGSGLSSRQRSSAGLGASRSGRGYASNAMTMYANAETLVPACGEEVGWQTKATRRMLARKSHRMLAFSGEGMVTRLAPCVACDVGKAYLDTTGQMRGRWRHQVSAGAWPLAGYPRKLALQQCVPTVPPVVQLCGPDSMFGHRTLPSYQLTMSLVRIEFPLVPQQGKLVHGRWSCPVPLSVYCVCVRPSS